MTSFNEREKATLIAALAHLGGIYSERERDSLASNAGTIEPLSPAEINVLAERIGLQDADTDSFHAMCDEMAKIAVATGRSKADGYDVDWFGLGDDVEKALAPRAGFEAWWNSEVREFPYADKSYAREIWNAAAPRAPIVVVTSEDGVISGASSNVQGMAMIALHHDSEGYNLEGQEPVVVIPDSETDATRNALLRVHHIDHEPEWVDKVRVIAKLEVFETDTTYRNPHGN